MESGLQGSLPLNEGVSVRAATLRSARRLHFRFCALPPSIALKITENGSFSQLRRPKFMPKLGNIICTVLTALQLQPLTQAAWEEDSTTVCLPTHWEKIARYIEVSGKSQSGGWGSK